MPHWSAWTVSLLPCLRYNEVWKDIDSAVKLIHTNITFVTVLPSEAAYTSTSHNVRMWSTPGRSTFTCCPSTGLNLNFCVFPGSMEYTFATLKKYTNYWSHIMELFFSIIWAIATALQSLLQLILVAVIDKAVPNANLSSTDPISTTVAPVGDGNHDNFVWLLQGYTPPGVSFCSYVSAGIIC